MEIRLRPAFWNGLRRLTQPFVMAYCVFEADLSRKLASSPVQPDFRVRLYQGEADLQPAIEALVPTGLAISDISARMRRGDLVAVGFLGNQAVAYTWASFSETWVTELGMKACARPNEMIQYDTLVLKPFRKHGLQFAVAGPVLEYARKNGYATTLSWVNLLNRPSYKNQKRWGKTILLTIVSVKIPGKRQKWTFSIGAPLASVFSKATTRLVPVAATDHAKEPEDVSTTYKPF